MSGMFIKKHREFVSVKDYGAVGDNITNDSNAFIAALAAGLNVYVPPVAVAYKISPNVLVTMQENQHLFGDGFASCLSMSSGDGTLLAPGDKTVFLSNIRLYGGDDGGKTTVAAAANNRHALGIYLNKKSILTNIVIHGFGNKGIYGDNSTTGRAGNLQMIGGQVYNCWQGIEAGPTNGEYTMWSNIHIGGCRIGFKCSSGNVHNINPSYNDNGYNFYLEGVGIANDSHGSVVGGQLNHANICNIYAENVDYGHVFSGVTIFAGNVHLKNCKGINITGGIFDVTNWFFEGGGANYVRNNTSPNGYGNVTNNDYNSSASNVIFENNVDLTGALLFSNAIKYAGLTRYQAAVDERFAYWTDSGAPTYGFQWSYLGGGAKMRLASVNANVVNTNPTMELNRTTGKIEKMFTALPNYASDAAASTGGLPMGSVYRNGSAVCVQMTFA